ncbi:type II toxin-antitoxin system death-on-curing family toxin [Paenibacillus daejeonensis]|uniref:type II toxin-antitoxin system death-on-curing family toxin n=1 Tax=Paenibacillus daejeonensis TaxID=135193 RepID=UPI000366FF38|nr:type II toxin-antitoxin system death-on-curing family toxin [Paenibacillus daejeonensis]
MLIKLTQQQILELHDYVLQKHGGLLGVREPGYLDLIVEKPFTEYYGEEQYPGLFTKAAVYWHGLAKAYCFSDGNKRTAIMTALVFLELNGFELEATGDELFETAIKVATSEMSLHELAVWIENFVSGTR